MNRDAPPDQHPMDLLKTWLAEARAAGSRRPMAMALATATLDGLPSVRMVIARGLDPDGITFYTDARSPKGLELAANPRAAATFYWPELNRSVRVAGAVKRLPSLKSDLFFAGYAPAIQRAMRVATQSAPLADRKDLERAVAADAASYPDGGPVAPGFAGYRIAPVQIEFWAEAIDAIHDRILFTRLDGAWTRSLLQP